MRPLHYDIRLDIFISTYSTRGEVDILLEVVETTKQIVLHTNYENLRILDVNVTGLSGGLIPIAHQLQDEDRELLILVLEETVEGGEYLLGIAYEGIIFTNKNLYEPP